MKNKKGPKSILGHTGIHLSKNKCSKFLPFKGRSFNSRTYITWELIRNTEFQASSQIESESVL